ncbi:DUF2461 domain-containing protein [Geodermatophilus sp. YIM 151500]|uniref:DUF2461 domain-containing protein n=1 Tax=Geodermatophilus sp. YIM 151500 TaxID=2984531 RepID=UPI0021E3BEE3|nr:DUF2461 domain-containing protein [Geodermatophilus sp. YIM 151500]MCV2488443.1 DUF2461 domain-containing protein [Geodermatophilus sp. YIM 151500]
MTFQGFPDAGLVFYEGLEADNSKTYWTRHKAVYEEQVRAPLQAMLDELAGEFGPAKVFRPYRDVRFSNDKTPYKTHQGAVVAREGSGVGAWYVQISAEGLLVAGGAWRLESDQVDRFRRGVADGVQGARLLDELGTLSAAGYGIEGDRLTRVPKGFDVDDARAALLRHKSLHASRRWDPADWLHDRRALDEVRAAWRAFGPLNRWLADNVGATTRDARRR